MSPWGRRAYDIHENTIHMVSLSCNPVPPVRYGGIELVIAHLCEGLAAAGADVLCYSPGVMDVSGVRHHRTLEAPTPSLRLGGVPNSTEHLHSVLDGLRKTLRRGDVVVFNHADHFRFLKRRLGFARWMGVHTCEIAHWMDAGVQRGVIYPSAALKEKIGKLGIVIPHGEKLLFSEDPQLARGSELFFPGRITRDKGVELALLAARELGVRLVLAGPLSEPGFSEVIVRDPQVDYLGELTYEELFPHYERARATVYMTQYEEPFGLSVIEAMAAGCPVITTGYGGTGETVLPGQTGFFCRTVHEIVEAYSKLSTIRSEACIERAREYSVERMVTSYLAYLRSLK